MTSKEEYDLYKYYRLGKLLQWLGLSQYAYRCFRISSLYYENVEFRMRDYGNEELALFAMKLEKCRNKCLHSLSQSATIKLKNEESKYKTENSFFVGYSIDWHDITRREKQRLFKFYF